jgi:hypothetical protein
LPVWNSCHQIEQENEQVIGATAVRRQRFLMSNLKIDQAGPIRCLVVDHIGHRGIAMGPATAELLTLKMMRAPILSAGCLQHLGLERSPVHVLPQVVTR